MTILIWALYLLVKTIVILTALTVLLSFTVAWYERANANPDLIGQRFTLRGVGIAIWLMVQETACLLITIALRPFGWCKARIHKGQPADRPPIILIHGLFQNRACLFWLEYRLRRAGLKHIYSINTPPWRDLETLTETLVKMIDELRVALQVDKVDLVGHSMGGIIGRNYVQNRGGTARVRKLVTLGSPHHGSKLAPFAVSSMGLTLLPGSEFLRTFNQTTLPAETQVTAIYTRYDNVVLPASSARMDGATNIELAGMGHTALLFHPDALQAVVTALTDGNP
jgi:triacylglycerol lipase